MDNDSAQTCQVCFIKPHQLFSCKAFHLHKIPRLFSALSAIRHVINLATILPSKGTRSPAIFVPTTKKTLQSASFVGTKAC